MKKLILSIVFAASAVGFAFAQNPSQQPVAVSENQTAVIKDNNLREKGNLPKGECPPPGRGFKEKGDKNLFEGLNLTPEQSAKIKTLKDKNKAKADKQRAKAEKQRVKDKESRDKEIKKILTPEQYAKYLDNVKKAKAHGKDVNVPGKDKVKKDSCCVANKDSKRACCKQANNDKKPCCKDGKRGDYKGHKAKGQGKKGSKSERRSAPEREQK